MTESTNSFGLFKDYYDHLVNIIDAYDGIIKDLYAADFGSKYQDPTNGMSSSYLIKHDELYRKKYIERVIYDTLSEFVNFTDTSLFASGNRKHSVAFALLRKPFREILDAWIFLVVDANFYVENLFDNPDKIDVSNYKIRKALREKIKDTSAFSSRGFDDYQYSTAYKLRYSTDEELSLSKLMTQANHLLTTSKGQESSSGTLNFVHFTELQEKPLWNIYYKSLYSLLIHASHILIILIEKHAPKFSSPNLERLYDLTWRIEKVFE